MRVTRRKYTAPLPENPLQAATKIQPVYNEELLVMGPFVFAPNGVLIQEKFTRVRYGGSSERRDGQKNLSTRVCVVDFSAIVFSAGASFTGSLTTSVVGWVVELEAMTPVVTRDCSTPVARGCSQKKCLCREKEFVGRNSSLSMS